MRRRDFIKGIVGSAAAARPFTARAQQPAMPVIGFLSSRMASESVSVVAAFHQGLKEMGYVEGQNVSIEYRWADFQDDRLPAMAADLVQRRVAVIAATGSTVAASTAKLATTTIPIVFGAGSDPVKEGLVANLNRPGGNITGVTPFTQQLGAKQLELLHSMVPTAAVVAVLGKRNDPDTEIQLKDVEAAARTLGLQILALTVDSKRDFQAAFATLVQRGAGALLIFSGAFFTANRVQLAILAARHGIPAIYTLREFPLAGGLMSYATRLTDSYHQVGVYVGQILKGAKPADLPILQPTKFEFVINLGTAQTLGLTVPPSLLAIADEVIE
jgi:putative tryptophan/tyrosine transport system substrate-binding protein